ncbi:hypothetical protein C2869_11175 [Saccharobesus litoralis]|uniref:RHS repeat-associated core domain-containing protein n=1 Tax=Saccharobesus litoralis TaxID=2172099 RepID=A0A2S0VRX9_9ALTE|nr:RHS repeat-associated core domain-containing protein [Saccharobesus litoralis]AWB66964.1 hypothetical protein C2869_11175 [Saccharobesus litoralis]
MSQFYKLVNNLFFTALSLLTSFSLFANSLPATPQQLIALDKMLAEIRANQAAGLKQLGAGLAGDRFDPATGSLSFYRPITTLSTNHIPIQVGQVLKDRRGWLDDIPHIRTKVIAKQGIHDVREGQFWGKDRCTQYNQSYNEYVSLMGTRRYFRQDYSGPQAIQVPYEVPVNPSFIQDGLTMITPGGNVQMLEHAPAPSLYTFPNQTQQVFYTTKNNWRITCKNDIGDNKGEGFIATSPQGLTYHFDVLAYVDYPVNHRSERKYWHYYKEDPQIQFEGIWVEDIPLQDAILYASKITDVYGNEINYTFTPSTEHTKRYSKVVISSDQGHEVSIDLTSTGMKGYRYTVDDREWTVDPNGTLMLPDKKSYWTSSGTNLHGYSSSFWGLHGDMEKEYYCQGRNWVSQVSHPNGTVVEFYFDSIRSFYQDTDHEENQTLDACESEVLHPLYMGGKGVRTYRLVKKRIISPVDNYPNNRKTYTWEYDYDYEYYTDSEGVVRVSAYNNTVYNPNGSATEYIVNNDNSSWLYGHTTQINVYQDSQKNVLLESKTFDLSAGLLTPNANTDALGGKTPVQVITDKVVLQRGNDVFTTEYKYKENLFEDSYSYGLPTQIKTYSNTQDKRERIQDITYKHLREPWIIGLRDTTTYNNRLFIDNAYNDLGQLISVSQFGQETDSLTYHTSGDSKGRIKTRTRNLTSGINCNPEDITSEDCRTTTFENYVNGAPTSIKRADGVYEYMSVNQWGLTESYTNGKNLTVEYKYNDFGWLTDIYQPNLAANTKITYTNLYEGVIETATLGDEQIITKYDLYYRPISREQKDKTGAQSSIYQTWSYDGKNSNGMTVNFASYPSTTRLEAESKGVWRQYDRLGRLTQQDNIKYEYLNNNEVKVTDGDNNVTTKRLSGYGSPNDGNIIFIKSPEDTNTEMKYDIWGNLTSVRQFGSHGDVYRDKTQRFTYSEQNRLCRKSIPEAGDSLYLYNQIGELEYYQDGQPTGINCPNANIKAASVQLTYDKMGRKTHIDYPDETPDVNTYYDDAGNVEKVTRGTTEWTYGYDINNLDTLSRETLYIDGKTFSTFYEINSRQQIEGIRYPSKDLVKFNLDAFGRPNHIERKNWSEETETYANNFDYHANGTVKSFTYGNGAKFEQTLNNRQLPEIRNVTFNDGRSDPMRLTYDYTAGDNVKTITNGLYPSRTITNTYDGLNRLNTSTSAAWGGKIAFKYDSLGNILERATPNDVIGINYHDYVNRLDYVTSNSSTHVFSHDNYGNVTNNGRHQFTYDLAHQPITISGNQNGSFVYDGNYKRVKQTIDGKTIYSVYTLGAGLVSQYNLTENLHTDYINAAGTSIAKIQSFGSDVNPDSQAFGEDISPLGDSGSIIGSEHYKPYGESSQNPADSVNDIDFTGHVKDSSGLVYMQARYYDPVIGRFYSNDPVSTIEAISRGRPVYGFNRYTYANNNPYKYTDPDGEWSVVTILAVVGVVALGGYAAGDTVKKTIASITEHRKNAHEAAAEGDLDKMNTEMDKVKKAADLMQAAPKFVDMSQQLGKGIPSDTKKAKLSLIGKIKKAYKEWSKEESTSSDQNNNTEDVQNNNCAGKDQENC